MKSKFRENNALEKTYYFNGTCTRSVTFTMDEDTTVYNISFVGGCNGNLQGVAALCEGMKAEDIIARVRGIRCGMKQTSCPDQLSRALEKALAELNG